jgi:REP element-mobilizing transposase RayT
MLHQNSQKRIYFDDAIYFVTICIKDRFPLFEEKIFCELFIEELRLAKLIKQFQLFGFVVLRDHVHLLIKPSDKYNISKII